MGLVEAVLEDMEEWRADMMRWRGWVQDSISDLNQEVNDINAGHGPEEGQEAGTPSGSPPQSPVLAAEATGNNVILLPTNDHDEPEVEPPAS